MPRAGCPRLDHRPRDAAARIRPRRDPPAAQFQIPAAAHVIALADLARSLAETPRALTVCGAPEGHDAATIGALVEGTWLHVCRDDTRMQRFAEAIGFFHPRLRVLTFPAWDCLPYDRVSPNGEITSRRIDTLTRLAASDEKRPLIVLTTVNALV